MITKKLSNCILRYVKSDKRTRGRGDGFNNRVNIYSD